MSATSAYWLLTELLSYLSGSCHKKVNLTRSAHYKYFKLRSEVFACGNLYFDIKFSSLGEGILTDNRGRQQRG